MIPELEDQPDELTGAASNEEREPTPTSWPTGPQFTLSPEDIPNLDNFVTEDDTPVDNIFVEKQQRLLVEPLYSSWSPKDGQPFLALANVGLFYIVSEPPLVPDMMLSLGVRAGEDLSLKQNRSYFLWIMKKKPDAVLEIVSDRYGEEAGRKMQIYAQIGIPYYVIFDPDEDLKKGLLRTFGLNQGVYQEIPHGCFEMIGLGLTFWQGAFEGHEARWLRWCDCSGKVIPTGQELAAQRLTAINNAQQAANAERTRADQERQRADQERQRAEQERQRAEQLAAQLRALGIELPPQSIA